MLLVLTLIFFAPIPASGFLGLCLPSPNLWHLPRGLGWVIDSLIIFLAAAVMSTANKKYNFVSEPYGLMVSLMLMLVVCNSISTSTLSTSTLLLLLNVVSLYVVFSAYEARNATREFFIIASLASVGSMVQYAFLLMIPAYIAAGITMKCFRLRELIAFIFGLAAPYWIVLGLGLVPLSALRLPGTISIISAASVENDIFFSIVSGGVMALIAFILSLYNGVHLFSRNSRLRCMHIAINFIGYMAVIAFVFDFANFMSYVGTLALWLAVETATLVSIYNLRRPGIVALVVMAIFLPFYFLELF